MFKTSTQTDVFLRLSDIEPMDFNVKTYTRKYKYIFFKDTDEKQISLQSQQSFNGRHAVSISFVMTTGNH